MAANYVLLQRIELNASAASVTFSNIPQSGYTDLKIVMSVRSDAGSNGPGINLSFNGNTSNFSSRILFGNGTSASSYTATQEVATANGGTTTASTFNNGELYIPNYLSSNNKSWSTDVVVENNATLGYPLMYAGLWSNTAAISSVTLTSGSGDFVQYSTFSLYGLAAVGTTPVIAPKATGGNITSDGTYWYHTFLSTGTFTPLQGLTCDALVIAGGGGGGGPNVGGGGGAGGYLYSASQSLAVGSYTCTVGAGGAGNTSINGTGTKGVNSQFGSITASVGGGGGSSSLNSSGALPGNGASGGSGGGAGNYKTAVGGAATSGQGFAGGNSDPNDTSGGGGGAGAVGANGSGTNNASAGGAGSNAQSAFATATSTGVSGYYAGGGASGGGSAAGRILTRSAGGGGNGTAGQESGVANTGSGGVGFTYNGGATTYPAGAGGSGIIIIRYLIA